MNISEFYAIFRDLCARPRGGSTAQTPTRECNLLDIFQNQYSGMRRADSCGFLFVGCFYLHRVEVTVDSNGRVTYASGGSFTAGLCTPPVWHVAYGGVPVCIPPLTSTRRRPNHQLLTETSRSLKILDVPGTRWFNATHTI